MSQITTLITGAGVNTSTGSIAQLESDILIGDVDTANALQALKVVVDSITTIDISSAAFCNFFAKFMNRTVGAGVVGLVYKVATGRIEKNAVITLQNNGATTPVVYANSTQKNGVPIFAVQDSVNVSSNKVINGFKCLAVQNLANISSFDVTYSDGTVQNMSIVEVDALFASANDTQTDGRLDASVTAFDNRMGKFASVKMNTNSTGAAGYMIIK